MVAKEPSRSCSRSPAEISALDGDIDRLFAGAQGGRGAKGDQDDRRCDVNGATPYSLGVWYGGASLRGGWSTRWPARAALIADFGGLYRGFRQP